MQALIQMQKLKRDILINLGYSSFYDIWESSFFDTFLRIMAVGMTNCRNTHGLLNKWLQLHRQTLAYRCLSPMPRNNLILQLKEKIFKRDEKQNSNNNNKIIRCIIYLKTVKLINTEPTLTNKIQCNIVS